MSLPVSLSIVPKPLSYKISRCLILLLMSNILSLAPLSLSTPTLSPQHSLSLIQHTLTHMHVIHQTLTSCVSRTLTLSLPVGVSYTPLYTDRVAAMDVF